MSPSYQIGAWVFDPSLHSLDRKGEKVLLRAKLVELLSCLVERSGEVLQREDILEQVWGSVMVTEDSLTRGVSELRKILGDDPARPEYIETIRKGGYRLVAEVRQLDQLAAVTKSPSRLRLALAMVLLLAGIAWWSAADSPAHLPSQSRMAAPVPFSSLPGRETDPAISADGERVAFSWGGADDDLYDLYVKNRRDGKLLRLTESRERDVHPSWSPDGRSIAFLRNGENGSLLCRVPAEGGPVLPIVELGAWASGLDWSPDAKTLVSALVGPRRLLRIVSIAVGDGSREELTSPPELFADHSPVFSPDGKQVAFVRSQQAGSENQIRLLEIASGKETAVCAITRVVKGIEWAGDPGELLLAAEADYGTQLFRLSLSDGSLQEVPLREEWVSYPSLSLDGKTLVYEEAEPTQDLICIDLQKPAGEGRRNILQTTQREREAYFSPDGSRIAFISDRSGDLEVWVSDARGESARRITASGRDRVAAPRWSPDGEWIAFQQGDAAGQKLWLVAEDGGIARPLEVEPAAELLCGWSSKGSKLYYAGQQDGIWFVWRHDLQTGESLRALDEPALMAKESADGLWLYFSRPDRSGIWRQAMTGGPAELLTEDHPPKFRGNWELVGEELVFTRWNGVSVELCSINLESRQTRVLCGMDRYLHAPSFSHAPLRGEIIYATASEGSGDLKVIESFGQMLQNQ